MTERRRAAIYCRISRDRHGDMLGVDRQERACRELVERRGWSVAGIYLDDDLSAYSGKYRPGYERMLDDVKGGSVDVIVALHPDRLHRRPIELEHFIDVVEATGCAVETVNAGKLDLSTRSGRTTARLLGTVARDESEAKSERLRAKHAELVDRGRWKGGPRPYGYRPTGEGGLEVDEQEAAVIRAAAHRVLAGDSLHAVVQDLNDRGVGTAQGARWRTQTMRRILTAWTVAGRREHKGADAGPAVWPAILDTETHRRLRAVILDPSRYREAPARVSLLAGGIARCGRCGSKLVTQRRTTGKRVYVCLRHLGGCGRLSIQADPLEALIVEATLRLLDGPELAEAMAGTDARDDHAEEVAARARMDELAEMWASGEISRSEWVTARQTLEGVLKASERRTATDARRSMLAAYKSEGGALRAAWPDMGLDRRRAVVAAVVDRVTVQPTDQRGPRFDPTRVDVTWIA
jgi:DNA invertase Pin-like site-specific DNA recombinase